MTTLLPTTTAGSLPKPSWLAQPETLWSPWKLLAFDMVERRVEEEWAFGSEKEGAHLIQIWLFPFSRHLANALA